MTTAHQFAGLFEGKLETHAAEPCRVTPPPAPGELIGRLHGHSKRAHPQAGASHRAGGKPGQTPVSLRHVEGDRNDTDPAAEFESEGVDARYRSIPRELHDVC